MTGRAAGYCAGYGVPGFVNPGPGRGLGMAWRRGGGRGAGGGWGFAPAPFPGAYAAPEPTSEEGLAALRDQADWLKQQLEAVNSRLQELQHEKE